MIQQGENQAANQDSLIPWYIVGGAALVCFAALLIIAVLGPAMLNVIHYRTSQSGIWQTQAFDVTDLIVLAPLLLAGAILGLMKKPASKFFLILTPITLMYVGVSYGLGQEWGNPAYSGNSEAYFWLFLILVVGGLILLMGSLSSFSGEDAPAFGKKWLRVYVVVMALFLLMFAAMWISQVISTGNTAAGDYLSAPNGWWLVKFLDLGFTIPTGFMALLLLLSKPKKAYPLVLLFFGFFITLGTAVNASAIILVTNHDPSVTGSNAGGLVIFPVLGILAYAGLFYLIKDKIRKNREQLNG